MNENWWQKASKSRVARALGSALALVILALPLRAQDSGIPVGSKAPAAVAETLDGKPANLDAWLGKEPIFIEFWATWCSNCKALEPQVVALQKKYAGKVRFVGVAVSANQSPELVKRYVAAHGLQGEQLYDRKGFATDAYEVPTTSYVVIINAKGVVVYTGSGSKQDLATAMAKAF
jgi:thiol-disulfide isomerase/thioredoxin